MEKKYILTDETKVVNGHTLHRIQAITSFDNIKNGDIGGWIETEDNLSQKGKCWIHNNARVYGCGRICDNVKICGNAEIFDYAFIFNNVIITGNAKIYGNVWIYDNVEICGNVKIYENAHIYGNAHIYNNAEIYGNVKVNGNTEIGGIAKVCKISDYILFKNWWSSGRYFTWTRSNNMWKVGCFYGTGEELIKKAYADSEESGREYERVVRYVESILAN
jgi:acetyltransferase-like isoleucine patch superfamily enzyme